MRSVCIFLFHQQRHLCGNDPVSDCRSPSPNTSRQSAYRTASNEFAEGTAHHPLGDMEPFGQRLGIAGRLVSTIA